MEDCIYCQSTMTHKKVLFLFCKNKLFIVITNLILTVSGAFQIVASVHLPDKRL